MINNRPAATRVTYYIGGVLITDNEVSHTIGEMVDHGTCGATVSSGSSSSVVTSVPLAGANHYIFRYTFREAMCSEAGMQWRICEDWEFITGRDDFIETVAYDSSDVPAATFMGDDLRGPYSQTD